jgi:hypothetical protein
MVSVRLSVEHGPRQARSALVRDAKCHDDFLELQANHPPFKQALAERRRARCFFVFCFSRDDVNFRVSATGFC